MVTTHSWIILPSILSTDGPQQALSNLLSVGQLKWGKRKNNTKWAPTCSYTHPRLVSSSHEFYSCVFHYSLEGYKTNSGLTSFHSIQLQKQHPECTKTRLFKLKNRKILWGWGTAHSPDLSSVGRETPLPTLYPLGAFGASILAPTTLDTRAFGARTQIFNRNRRHCIMSENLSHHLLQKGLGLGCQRLADHITDLQSCYASRLLQLDAAKTQLHLVWISSCSLRGLRQSLPDDRTLTIIDVLQPTDVRATSVCYWTASWLWSSMIAWSLAPASSPAPYT